MNLPLNALLWCPFSTEHSQSKAFLGWISLRGLPAPSCSCSLERAFMKSHYSPNVGNEVINVFVCLFDSVLKKRRGEAWTTWGEESAWPNEAEKGMLGALWEYFKVKFIHAIPPLLLSFFPLTPSHLQQPSPTVLYQKPNALCLLRVLQCVSSTSQSTTFGKAPFPYCPTHQP